MYGHLGPPPTMPFQLFGAAGHWRLGPWCLVDLHMEIKNGGTCAFAKIVGIQCEKILRDNMTNSWTLIIKQWSWKKNTRESYVEMSQ